MSQVHSSHHINKVIKTQVLVPGTSKRKAKLTAPTRALVLSQGKKVNIYLDSKYASMVVHIHGAIWKERGLLILGNMNIIHAEENLRLLEAVNLPDQTAIKHCLAHRRDSF